MNKRDQNIFYKAFGDLVSARRKQQGHTYASLSKLVGEQNITIRNIEKGTRCSLHHLVWAQEYLGITHQEIIRTAIRNRESKNGKEIGIENII